MNKIYSLEIDSTDIPWMNWVVPKEYIDLLAQLSLYSRHYTANLLVIP